jgi:hypothetical protein
VWGLASAEHLWTPSFLLDVSIARHQPPTFTITSITALAGIRSTVPRIKCRFNFICVKNSQRRRRRSEEEASIMSIHMPEDAASVLEQFMHDGA